MDKLIICGTFIYLAAVPNSGIIPWMAVLVVARELLITALRGHVEGVGGDFSANTAGKWKMVLQCVAAGASLMSLHLARAIASLGVVDAFHICVVRIARHDLFGRHLYCCCGPHAAHGKAGSPPVPVTVNIAS